MFCLKCGEAVPDDSRFCPKCGAELMAADGEQIVVYASQKNEEAAGVTETPKKKIPKKLITVVVAAAVVFAVVLAVLEIGKANLKWALMKEWYASGDSILKVLDIDDNEMEYRLETGYTWMDTTLGTYEWKVVSGNKIKIKRFGDKYETFTVELNKDKDVLKISPAITSVDSSETWYYID